MVNMCNPPLSFYLKYKWGADTVVPPLGRIALGRGAEFCSYTRTLCNRFAARYNESKVLE